MNYVILYDIIQARIILKRKYNKMKTDRILEIIIYLLNHDNVPAKYFAERFNVSLRTIQRDMITISSIGIPVYANLGKQGGYSILPEYKIRNYEIRDDEQRMIKGALETLATSYTNETLNKLIEKYNALIDDKEKRIFWDFSVSKENSEVQNINSVLEKAISNRNYVSFTYRNANGGVSSKYIEPLAIHYKWYAWYLFAYSPQKQSYITFKVARISDLTVDNKKSTLNHGDVRLLMDKCEQEYYKTCIHIDVRFKPENIGLMKEYFPDCPIEKITDEEYRIFIDVPEKERLWKALLLSFGNKIKVVSPQSYKNDLYEMAKKFLSNYDIQLS